jgi:hypothetical protein
MNQVFPLIFISGIFVPFAQMRGPGLALAYCSPLTYLVDLSNPAMSGASVFSPAEDCGVLVAVSAVFILVARILQTRNLVKGLSEGEEIPSRAVFANHCITIFASPGPQYSCDRICAPTTTQAMRTGPTMNPTMPMNGTPPKMPIIIMTGWTATRFPIITGR